MYLIEKINRSISYMAYLLVAIAIIGFFSIYLPEDNPGTPLIVWLVLAGFGGSIVGLKTLNFPSHKRLKIVLYDLIYTLILIFFSLFSLPFDLNFILGAIISSFFLYYQIDQKVLVHLK